MNTRILTTAVQGGVLFSLCAACATTDPLIVDFGMGTTGKSSDIIEKCIVKIAPVIDERKGKEDLGMLGAQVVEGRHAIPWLQQGIETLNSPGVEKIGREVNRENARSLDVQVALTQLYVHPLQSSFAANILLHAQYQLDQNSPHLRQYRGADTNVNWTGSAGSILTLFNDILDDVLRRMRADINRLCQGTGGR